MDEASDSLQGKLSRCQGLARSNVYNGQGLTFSEEFFSDDQSDAEEDTRDVQEVLEDLLKQQQRWEQEMNKDVVNPQFKNFLIPSSKCKPEASEGSWGNPETKHLIEAKAELEKNIPQQSENLWERISANMNRLGYSRTPEECKRKWKKLVNRYKRLSGHENSGKFPFYEDLEAIFQSRLKSQADGDILGLNKRLLFKIDGDISPTRRPGFENEHLSDEVDSGDGMDVQRKRRKMDAGVNQVLCEFIVKQQSLDQQWQDFVAKRELEWQKKDEEWMLNMLKLQKERLDREMEFRERQEQRRARQEARDQNVDRIFALLAGD